MIFFTIASEFTPSDCAAKFGTNRCRNTAGATEAVHEKTLEKCFQQYTVPVKGQCDILITGIPFISPYNVNSTLNPRNGDLCSPDM